MSRRLNSGNARPVRTIQGRATGLNSKVITGIAVSARDGVIYVMVKAGSAFGTGRVAVYGRLARGDAAPLRTFTDRKSHFADALGLAILAVGRRRQPFH